MLVVYCYKASCAMELAEELEKRNVDFEFGSVNEIFIEEKDYEAHKRLIDEYATEVRP